ncbi:MAG: DUF896 domain-containing protein [Clostridiales bacterium]|jgi:uncharacterized protein YnzC (UPF0291/DUF896 family)|nr:DUF896 domain-containing protein [Clostridiales bacterium]
MDQVKIDRINELARKSKTIGLSAEEKEEQAKLRQEYRDSFKRNLVSILESCVIVDEQGNRRKVRAKED